MADNVNYTISSGDFSKLYNLINELKKTLEDFLVSLKESSNRSSYGGSIITIGGQSGTISSFKTGSKSNIGASAVQITSSDIPCTYGVIIKADNDNTGDVYIGPSGVTAGTNDATDGIRLKAGEDVFFPIDNVNKVYAIASGSGQKVYFLAI